MGPRGRRWCAALTLGVLAALAAAVASGSADYGSHAGSATGAGSGAWTGTVRLVEDADHTFNGHDTTGRSLTAFLTYHDEAVYTLSGETTADGLSVAQLAGSGKGRVSGTSPGVCVLSYDPYLEWSYSGQALVRVSYSGGKFVVQPQSVTADYHSLRTGCGIPDLPSTSQLPAPYGIGQLHPQGVAEPESATTITGSESFPLTFFAAQITEVAGTATLTSDLHSTGVPSTSPPPPGSPPTGASVGAVLVNGKPYKSGQPIPYGSTVDVTNGRLTLATEVGTLTVYGGGVSAVFKLLKFAEKGKPLIELRLIKGDFSVCTKKAFRAAYATKPPGKTVRRLFAKGKGRFRSRGRYSSAAVRGTFWLTADRCDGTLTQVKQGKLEVRDFAKKKTVLVKAGQSYLAAPR